MDVWPDNMPIVEVFSAMTTQWRSGFSGATGLDYGVLPTIFRIHQIARRDWQVIFDGLRVMESVALDTMHAK